MDRPDEHASCDQPDDMPTFFGARRFIPYSPRIYEQGSDPWQSFY
jgi:hypothetical protein